MNGFKTFLIREDLMDKINTNKIIIDTHGDSNNDKTKEELTNRIETIEEINKNGGCLYRLLFLDSFKDLKGMDIGENWVADPTKFKNIFDKIKQHAKGKNPFIIKAMIPQNQIDINKTLVAFKMNPFDGLVKLKGNPKQIVVQHYDINKDYSNF